MYAKATRPRPSTFDGGIGGVEPDGFWLARVAARRTAQPKLLMARALEAERMRARQEALADVARMDAAWQRRV